MSNFSTSTPAKQIVSRFLLLYLAPLLLFGADPGLYAILRDRLTASSLVMYNPKFGILDCKAYGTQTVDTISIKGTNCPIDPYTFKQMKHYTQEYMIQTIPKEQKYKIDYYAVKMCTVYNGTNIYSEQLMRDGYGLLFFVDTSPEGKELRDRLQKLQKKARLEKRGLWKEWKKEMECLQQETNQLAATAIAEMNKP